MLIMSDGGTVKKKTTTTTTPKTTTTAPKTTTTTTAPKTTTTTSTAPKAVTTAPTVESGLADIPKTSTGSSYAPAPKTAPKVAATPTATPTSIQSGGGFTPTSTAASTTTSPTAASGTSTYTPLGTYNDQALSAADKAKIDSFKSIYAEAQASGNKDMMDWAHQQAEGIRSGYNYSGGSDGSAYLQLTPQQQQVQSEAIQSIDGVMNGFRDVQNSAKQYGDEGLVAIGAQWEKMNEMLNNLEAQITQQITSQMNGDDPAMKNALRLIREEADRMRQETMEELNARGLLQSGVYAKALSDMNNNELSQVQSAVASRFGDLQNQLNQAVLSIANTRVQALMTNQNAANSMLMNTQNNMFQAGLAGANAAVTVRGQDLQNSQFGQEMDYKYAGMAQNQSQFDATLGFNQQQLQQQSQQFYDKLSQDDRQFYDSLSSSEKMGYASIAASRGTQAAQSSLAQDRFEWEKTKDQYNMQQGQQQWDYSVSEQNKLNTNAQVGQAAQQGGLVSQAINNIVKGQSTVGEYRDWVKNMGYTTEAQQIIMQMIEANPEVQKKITTTNTPKKSYTTSGYWTPMRDR